MSELNWRDEKRIREAVRHGDAEALHQAIENLPSWNRDFDQVEEVVRESGGNRYCHFGRIEVDDPTDGVTTVRNHWGHAESEHQERW